MSLGAWPCGACEAAKACLTIGTGADSRRRSLRHAIASAASRLCVEFRSVRSRVMHISSRFPLALIAFIAMASTAHAECLSSADAVWAAHPGSHAMWRMQLPGHVGEKCWYAKNSTDLPAPRAPQVVDSPRRPELDRRTGERIGQAKGPVADLRQPVPKSRNQAARSVSPIPTDAAGRPIPIRPPESVPYDGSQRALVDRASNYLSSLQSLTSDFVQIAPDGSRSVGKFETS